MPLVTVLEKAANLLLYLLLYFLPVVHDFIGSVWISHHFSQLKNLSLFNNSFYKRSHFTVPFLLLLYPLGWETGNLLNIQGTATVWIYSDTLFVLYFFVIVVDTDLHFWSLLIAMLNVTVCAYGCINDSNVSVSHPWSKPIVGSCSSGYFTSCELFYIYQCWIIQSFCSLKPLCRSSESVFLFITPHEQTLKAHYLLPFPDHFEYCLQDNVRIRCLVFEQLAPQSNARAHLQGDAAMLEWVSSAFLQAFWRARGSLISFPSWKWDMYLKNLSQNQSHLGLCQ